MYGKLNGVHNGVINGVQLGTLLKQFTDYVARVLADSGLIKDRSVTSRYMQMAKSNVMLDSIRFAWLGEAGYKHRTSGINTFWTKLYSLIGTNDATQTTSTNQPYLSGNIAPNEKWCLKNPNGGDEYMTHPTISFAANEAWSVTTVIAPYGSNAGENSRILGNDTANKTRIELAPNGGTLYVYGEAANGSIAIPNRKGKRTVLHVTYNGAGVVSVSINATAIGTININNSFAFNTINRASGGQYFFGENSGVMIRAGELTLSQKQAEANFLCSIYPEIPSVTIGSQVWATSNCEMVATPQCTLIPEMQANNNVEKITGGNFESGLIGTKHDGAGSISTWTLNNVSPINGVQDGRLIISTSSDGEFPRMTWAGVDTTTGKYYKWSFSYRVNSGAFKLYAIYNGGGITYLNVTLTGSGTYTAYILATGYSGMTTWYLGNSVCDVQLDNISFREVGWSDSQNLYDYIYANTSGTDEQKTYAAVKAAAMWSYYNNDAALGAVYGKLYNWYAVKLLQMDIDYYNAANPSTPWGWRVPTDTDFNTLATTLGGASVAGGKMKKEGEVYWNSPNTGADNSSGFSAIGAGIRYEDGVFGLYALQSRFYNVYGTVSFVHYAGIELLAEPGIKIHGNSLRLIKS